MASILRSRAVQEKMSMFTMPVSGQVWSTACDSRRIRTQVKPVAGNACDTVSTIVAPARAKVSMNRSATSSPARTDNAAQPERSAVNEAGDRLGATVLDYSGPADTLLVQNGTAASTRDTYTGTKRGLSLCAAESVGS